MTLVFPEEYMILYKDTKPAYRKVYCILRATILGGQASSMPKLTEIAVSEALEVSRTPVRAALAQLEKDGILDSRTKKSGNGRRLTKNEKLQLLFWDEMLEANAAFLAATNISPEELAVLEELERQINGFTVDVAAGNPAFKGVRDIHMQFHLMIAKASGNQYLYKSIVESRGMLRMLQTERQHRENHYETEVSPFHAHLLEAFRQGDGDSARLWMQAELRNSREGYLKSQIAE